MRIGVTQRVDHIESYGEYRDALDQQWMIFLEKCGIQGIPIPNALSNPSEFAKDLAIKGLLLTGGNDLSFLPNAKNTSANRDFTEKALIDFASKNGLPIIGVCRGMQLLAHVSDEKLERINNHVAVKHEITPVINWMGCTAIEVNSFHNWGIKELKEDSEWQEWYKCVDGSLEAILHKTVQRIGIMWHPERTAQFNSMDINIFKTLFNS